MSLGISAASTSHAYDALAATTTTSPLRAFQNANLSNSPLTTLRSTLNANAQTTARTELLTNANANTAPSIATTNRETQVDNTLTGAQREQLYSNSPNINQQPLYASFPYELINGYSVQSPAAARQPASAADQQTQHQIAFGNSVSQIQLQNQLAGIA